VHLKNNMMSNHLRNSRCHNIIARCAILDEETKTYREIYSFMPSAVDILAAYGGGEAGYLDVRLNKVYRADLSGSFIMAAGTHNAA
jgi:hypothetical protein